MLPPIASPRSARRLSPMVGVRACWRFRLPTATGAAERIFRKVDVHHAQPATAPPVRRRPGQRSGAAGDRARPREQPMGTRGRALLRRRGRALHQRPGRRDRSVLPRRCAGHRGSTADRADGGRGLELRAGARLDSRVVRLDDQRARRVARARAGRWQQPRRDRRLPPRPGVPPRATIVPSPVDGRGDRA